MERIKGIDFTRGIVMIVMALDHARDLMHINSITQNPTDLLTTTPLLFFTRFITHFCAPVFVFLAGTSAYISLINRNNVNQGRNFMIKRGLWLLLLEFTIVNFGIYFDFGFHTFLFQVIATIGSGFIILGLLIRLSAGNMAIIGLTILFFHNLFPVIPFGTGSLLKIILTPLFGITIYPVTAHTNFIMAYPPVPWLGIMLLGFAAGKIFELAAEKRKKIFLKIGLAALLFFVIIRFVNIYGDPSGWSLQKDGIYTIMSFINVTKYPPSLLFCSLTLGIMFLVFAITEKTKSRFMNEVSVFGKVPMFYFLIHFFLIHIVMITLMFIQGFDWQALDFASGSFGRPKGVQSGVGLLEIYLIWIGVVAILYKPCLWYGRYKAEHKGWWLRYI